MGANAFAIEPLDRNGLEANVLESNVLVERFRFDWLGLESWIDRARLNHDSPFVRNFADILLISLGDLAAVIKSERNVP